ncbi:MAG: pyruvate kinase, partial [Pseudomonadota bacterium]
MPRRTKIVATLGPASDDPNTLSAMIAEGMDVARINFSHGKPDEMRHRVAMVRDIAAQQGRYVGVLGDLQGPKIRISRFRDGPVELKSGRDFFIDSALDPAAGTVDGVSTAYPELHGDVATGDTLLLDDGHISLEVRRVDGTRIHTRVRVGGKLSDRKGVSCPDTLLPLGALTPKDRSDLEAALDARVDWIALSFIQRPEDLAEVRKVARGRASVLAKIEKPQAIER